MSEGFESQNVRAEKKQEGWGDIWTWVRNRRGYEAGRFLSSRRADGGWAHEFMEDCASRIRNRVQIATDGQVYLDAVENAFGADIDYAQLQKVLLLLSVSDAVPVGAHVLAVEFYNASCRARSLCAYGQRLVYASPASPAAQEPLLGGQAGSQLV